MASGLVLAFWGTSLLLVLTPGADWAYTISAGLRQRTVVPAVSGLLVGYVATTLAVAAGIATVVARTPVLLTVLTTAGATYLIWMGLTTLRTSPGPLEADGLPTTAAWQQLVKGAAVSGMNPKAILLFLALLPQFTDPTGAWPIALQIAALGLVHITSCGVVYSLVGRGARTVLRTRPAATHTVSRFSGAAMILIGCLLLAEQLLRR